MGSKQAEKGARTEEVLRRYFLEQGYFVVRALKLRQDSVDVTDVDLWLYQRPSAMVRERVIVDAKDRMRPKAMERILWAVGARELTGVDRCIVATGDRRREVKEFAARGDVLVLDGTVLSRLADRFFPPGERLTEEEFAQVVFPRGDETLLRDWRRRVDGAKSRLLQDVEFDACNAWLEEVGYFLDAARPGAPRADAALRVAYLLLSFLLVGLDWVMRRAAFEERDARSGFLEAGLRFGSRGVLGFETLLQTTESLLVRFFPDMSGTAATLRNRARAELERLPAHGLAEFLARNDLYTRLFPIARAFEQAAYAREAKRPVALEVSAQAVLGAVLDYFEVPRSGFLGTAERSSRGEATA